MKYRSQRVRFANAKGISLCGIMDFPETEPMACCLFAHCFTCGKDLKAIVRISRKLAELGFAVLRFDFTGIGNSRGKFRETTFADNCDDVRAAANWMSEQFHPPSFLIGHSLGGAAIMSTAMDFESVLGIVTVAAPSDTHHLAKFLARTNSEIENQGRGEVTIGGRKFMITQAMLTELEQHDLESRIQQLQLPHLVMHSPQDETLAFEHAHRIFQWSGGPGTFVNLDDSDHLLLKHPGDVAFVARWIATWAERILALN